MFRSCRRVVAIRWTRLRLEAAQTVMLQTADGVQWIDVSGQVNPSISAKSDGAYIAEIRDVLAKHRVPVELVSRATTPNWLPHTRMSVDRRWAVLLCRSARVTDPEVHAQHIAAQLHRGGASFSQRMRSAVIGDVANAIQREEGSPSHVGNLHVISQRLTIFVSVPTGQPDANPKVISVHQEPIEHLCKMQDNWTSEHRTTSLDRLLYSIVRSCASSFLAAEQRHLDTIDILERRLFSRGGVAGVVDSVDLSEMYRIRREASASLRVLRVLFKAYEKLLWCCHIENQELLRSVQQTINASISVCEALHEQSSALLSLQISVAARDMEHLLQVLTLFTSVFIPLELVTNLFGMGFDSIAEFEKRPDSLLFVVCCLLVTLGATVVWMRATFPS